MHIEINIGNNLYDLLKGMSEDAVCDILKNLNQNYNNLVEESCQGYPPEREDKHNFQWDIDKMVEKCDRCNLTRTQKL